MLTTRRGWLLAAAASAGAACALVAPKFERPDIAVAGIELVGGNLLQQNFLVKLTVQNPNDRALPVTGLHAELTVSGERLATGVSDQPFVVPAHGSAQFDLAITANVALALLKLSQRSDGQPASIDYEVTGVASLDLPFMHQLPFHQKGAFAFGGR
jgi:LEA14-like dessication related protein